MGCIYFIGTEYTSRCDHTDRQFTFFHNTNLYRRSLGTKYDLVIDVESILLIFCRMVCRNIQSLKVVVIILYFRSFYDFISHTNKDTLYFFQGNGIWMTVSNAVFLCRKCYVDDFFFQFVLQFQSFHFFLSLFQFLLDSSSGLIYHLTNQRTLLRADIFHSF